jgi:Na+-transporting NADH:ubiquinone oxidoreductase subunit B
MKKIILKQVMMNKVLYSLTPIILFSIFLFGWRVLAVLIASNLAAFLTEYIFIKNKPGKKVSMAVFVTGTLLGLTLPPTMPLWIAAVGAVVAVLFGRMVFGGFGMNVFNPAIVGRTFIYISFPNYMTVNWLRPFTKFPGGFTNWMQSDLLTSATPIGWAKTGAESVSDLNAFFGLIPGSIGETSALLILLAGIYLIVTKTAKWQPMVSTLLSFIVFTLIFYQQNPIPFLVYGGLLFGTVFMTTDPVSMPKEKRTIWIYGILVGFLTVFIRRFSLFSEGFMFAILLANSFTPIIEYGMKKLKK